MLGAAQPVKWKQDAGALVIEPPAARTGRYAYTFRITCRKPSPDPVN